MTLDDELDELAGVECQMAYQVLGSRSDAEGVASWILDGDLGPHDVLETRLERADTVAMFDPPTPIGTSPNGCNPEHSVSNLLCAKGQFWRLFGRVEMDPLDRRAEWS